MKNIGPTAENTDIKYHIHMYVTKGADTLYSIMQQQEYQWNIPSHFIYDKICIKSA